MTTASTMTTADQMLTKTSVDHSRDEISRQSIEQLEMRRLGLPVSFCSAKAKRNKKRHLARQQHQRQHQTEGEEGEEDENLDKESDQEMIANDPQQEEQMDTIHQLEPDEYDDSVQEVPTIKLANDANDFLDLNELRLSLNSPETESKRAFSEVVAVEEDSLAAKKKKKRQRQKAARLVSNNCGAHGMKQYWNQRFVLFSRFAEGIRLDAESWYSVTPEPIARHIAGRIERALINRQVDQASCMDGRFIILDGFCGAGGNTIQFALLPSTALVYAVDIDPAKIELARHNATIYGCVDKIQFIVADFFQVIQSDRLPLSLVDVCFLSPPWGGPDYNRYPTYSLNQMTPNGFDIARTVAHHVTRNISFLLPRNFDTQELEPLSRIVYENKSDEMRVEIEENLLYKKVKTMTAYFGDLVNAVETN